MAPTNAGRRPTASPSLCPPSVTAGEPIYLSAETVVAAQALYLHLVLVFISALGVRHRRRRIRVSAGWLQIPGPPDAAPSGAVRKKAAAALHRGGIPGHACRLSLRARRDAARAVEGDAGRDP